MHGFVCLETALESRLNVWSTAEVNRKIIIHALEQSQVGGGDAGKQLTFRVLCEMPSIVSKVPSKPSCSHVQSSSGLFPPLENCRTRKPRDTLTGVCHSVPFFLLDLLKMQFGTDMVHILAPSSCAQSCNTL